jgi:hypothetical protein
MKTWRRQWAITSVALALLEVSLWGVCNTCAAPRGLMKQAIHFGISVEFLDPSTDGHSVAADGRRDMQTLLQRRLLDA